MGNPKKGLITILIRMPEHAINEEGGKEATVKAKKMSNIDELRRKALWSLNQMPDASLKQHA